MTCKNRWNPPTHQDERVERIYIIYKLVHICKSGRAAKRSWLWARWTCTGSCCEHNTMAACKAPLFAPTVALGGEALVIKLDLYDIELFP